MSTKFYCVKCRHHVEVEETRKTFSKNKKRMLVGVCPECGTKVQKFYSKKGADNGRDSQADTVE